MRMSRYIEPVTEALAGITWLEWKKLSMLIDRSFEIKSSELANTVQLATLQELIELNRSLFE